MSRPSQFGSPFGSGGTGGRRRLPLVAIAAAALTGTIVGGASAYTVVMAVVQPAKHDTRAIVMGNGGDAPPKAGTAQQTQASSNPLPQSAPATQTTPPAPGPGKAQPDALAERTDQGAATTAGKSVAPTQEVSSSANDGSAAANQSPPESGQEHAAPAKETSVTERAPWPTPRSAMKKHPVAASESAEPATTAEQPTPKAAAADSAAPSNSASTNKSHSDPRKSRFARQQPRTPDDADQSDNDRAVAAYPRQRVIILPGPPQQRDVSADRWNRDGGGPPRLFDFFGSHDHAGDGHWGNDRWHDDDRD